MIEYGYFDDDLVKKGEEDDDDDSVRSIDNVENNEALKSIYGLDKKEDIKTQAELFLIVPKVNCKYLVLLIFTSLYVFIQSIHRFIT